MHPIIKGSIMQYSEVLSKIRTFGSQGAALVLGMSGADSYEVSSEGTWIQGNQGKAFLDCGSFALFLFGHANPLFRSNLSQLLSSELCGTSRVLCHSELAIALEKLASLAPPSIRKVMLLNSGAEAVEAAIKLCRLKTSRSKIAHLSGSYHGKTAGALSITDCKAFKSPTHPLLQDVVRIDREDIAGLRAVLARKDVAGLFLEPIQGEGGIFTIAPDFLKAAQDACRENGTLLIADEIQCGLGRSGHLWAFERAEILPDILLTGKSLGGGIVPVSALMATQEAFSPYDRNPFMHSSTYGGNPLACRAVITAHQIVSSPGFLETVRTSSSWITAKLDQLVKEFPEVIPHWSGSGLMLGLHFSSHAYAAYTLEHCLKLGVILSPCLSTPHVLRITPPFSISEDDASFLYDCLKKASLLCLQKSKLSQRVSYAAS